MNAIILLLVINTTTKSINAAEVPSLDACYKVIAEVEEQAPPEVTLLCVSVMPKMKEM